MVKEERVRDERGPRRATNVAARALHVVSPQRVVSTGQDRAPVGREGSLGRALGTLEAREWL